VRRRWSLLLLVERIARVAGLLDLEWTQDADVLHARLSAGDGRGGDVVLTDAEEAASQRTAERLNRMWALGSGLSRFLY